MPSHRIVEQNVERRGKRLSQNPKHPVETDDLQEDLAPPDV